MLHATMFNDVRPTMLASFEQVLTLYVIVYVEIVRVKVNLIISLSRNVCTP